MYYQVYGNIVVCGDRPEHKVNAAEEESIVMGTVILQDGQTYKSCRGLCKQKYPDFQYYQKFIKYKSCTCEKLKPEKTLYITKHGAYTFGYANYCDGGMFIKHCDD